MMFTILEFILIAGGGILIIFGLAFFEKASQILGGILILLAAMFSVLQASYGTFSNIFS